LTEKNRTIIEDPFINVALKGTLLLAENVESSSVLMFETIFVDSPVNSTHSPSNTSLRYLQKYKNIEKNFSNFVNHHQFKTKGSIIF